MKKKVLREQMRKKRRMLSDFARIKVGEKIAEAFFSAFPHAENEAVCLYSPIDGEVPTSPLFMRNFTIYLPKIIAGEMQFCLYDGALQSGAYNILEPVESKALDALPDYVIVPGLAFDLRGYRVGFGKGFYDKYFSAFPSVKKIGISYDFQVVDCIEDVHENDVKMDCIITEKRIIKPFS